MRIIVTIATMAVALWQAVLGVPCWDVSDSCGSAPLCNPDPPENYISASNCFHVFCDDADVCNWDSTKKEILEVSRVKYLLSTSPNVYCVGAQHLNGTGNCCKCNQPGVIYEPGS